MVMKVYGYSSGNARITYRWGYYHSAEGLNGHNFKTQLQSIISDHRIFSYSQVWKALKRTDQDSENPHNVIELYTRRSIPKDRRDRGGSAPNLWNREHVWAKSHGSFGTRRGPGTDIHHLRPSDKSVNFERSNKDFAEGGSRLRSSDDCPLCMKTDATFEPPDEVKGDVARMIFYMATRYAGFLEITQSVGSGKTSGKGYLGKLSDLLKWNEQDPVSDEELHRNNLIFDEQGNRNPFIDHPEWVNEIFT